MANLKQAKKRNRQAKVARERNFALRTRFRNIIKLQLRLIDQGNKQEALQQFEITKSVLDKIAGKGVFHKNKAARHKSRLSARVKAMS